VAKTKIPLPDDIDDFEVTDHVVIRWLERFHDIDFTVAKRIVLAVIHDDPVEDDRPIKDSAIVRIIQNAYRVDLTPIRRAIRDAARGREIVPKHGQGYIILETGHSIVVAKRSKPRPDTPPWFMVTVLDPDMNVFRNDPTGAELLAERRTAGSSQATDPGILPSEPPKPSGENGPMPQTDGDAMEGGIPDISLAPIVPNLPIGPDAASTGYDASGRMFKEGKVEHAELLLAIGRRLKETP
jgi:hypothetical protein